MPTWLKLSDKSGPQRSKGELQRFYEAYRTYGKDWKKVAAFVRNRSVEMVEALYTMNRAYLALPEGMASVVGLIAMMTDHYNVMEGSDSERESNDAAGVPRKSQKRKRGCGHPKCQRGCGHPTQRRYHVRRFWLNPTKSLLVVFKELGGDASRITLGKRTVASIFSDTSEHHPTTKDYNIKNESYDESTIPCETTVHLQCAPASLLHILRHLKKDCLF